MIVSGSSWECTGLRKRTLGWQALISYYCPRVYSLVPCRRWGGQGRPPVQGEIHHPR